jgi:hypothetical protein
MNDDITAAEDLLRAINFKAAKAGPGLHYDISARTSNRSREVLNNVMIEKVNDTSRLSEDVRVEKYPLASEASPLTTASVGQKAFGSNIAPAITSSRFTGITVQHCRPSDTAKRPGVKLAVSLQTPELATTGDLFLLTAELKRYSRLREIKNKLDDSSTFAQLLEEAKRQIYEERDYNMVMGRMHLRGRRSAWIHNCLAVGRLVDDQVRHVILFLDSEEYVVELTSDLTPGQQDKYYTTGQWGTIAHPNSHSASLHSLIRQQLDRNRSA